MFNGIIRLIEEEQGQGLVEYALILVLVALAMISGLNILRGGLTTFYTDAANQLENLSN